MREHSKNILIIFCWFPRIWLALIILPIMLIILFFLAPIMLLFFVVSRKFASFMIENIIKQ
jgi:hypothetical protein